MTRNQASDPEGRYLQWNQERTYSVWAADEATAEGDTATAERFTHRVEELDVQMWEAEGAEA